MKSWTVVIWLVVSQLAELGCGKRFDPAMVDPLIRRSPLDKNFMRFGRSSPAYEDKEDADESPPGEDTFLRPMRGKDNNFMRFGRGKGDNYMRFGRGKQDSFMRFGRARNDNFIRFGRGSDNNFMRFGRGKQDNFMRFGRGKQDNFMRFGRGKEDNYMRFGRAKQDNFMRFGKGVNYGKQDSFMRLGRGKNDNFMRFGRELVTSNNLSSGTLVLEPPDPERVTRGRDNNFMRFGKKSEEDPLNDFPFEVQSINPKQTLVRIVRGKQDNFMRFGKSDDEKSFAQGDKEQEDKESKIKDNFQRPIDLEMIRFGRHPVRNNNAFIRYGRNSQALEDNQDEVIPQRLKRSILSYDSPDVQDTLTLPEDLEEEYAIPMHPEEYNNRKKRSIVPLSSTPSPDQDSVVDYISAKLRLQSSQPQFEPSLLSAGLPNVIVGPEFSLLPDLDPPASMLKRGRPGDKSFLRLG